MKYHIVVVDDEVELVNNLKYELEDINKDFKVLAFSAAYDALNAVLKGKVDIVLSDIAIPDMDGYELYSRIKEHDANIPVVLMTGFGYDPNHVVVRSKQKGEVDVVPKPFNTDKLAILLLKRLKERIQQKED